MYAALPADYNTVGRAGSRGKSLESLEDVPLGYPPSPAPPSHPQLLDWRPRSFEDGDLTPTNDAVDAGGGTLPRPRHCLVRPRPVAKVYHRRAWLARPPDRDLLFQVTATPGQFKSLPRDFDNKYQLTYGLESSPHLSKRCPPSPPRRQSSRDANGSSGDVVIDCSGPVPTASCDDHHIHQHHHHHLLHHPPAPAPAAAPSTPSQLNRPPSSMSRSWGSVSVNVNEEHELIASLALQHRNGSDASFKVCLEVAKIPRRYFHGLLCLAFTVKFQHRIRFVALRQ